MRVVGDPVMLTIDLEGDWGGPETRALREVLPSFLELLDRTSTTATFFLVAGLLEEVRSVLPPDGPHEVASHGLTHRPLTKLRHDEVAFEVEESKRILEANGYTVLGFRAPYFRSPPSLPGLLAQAGYTYDASRGSVYPRPRVRRTTPGHWNTTPPVQRLDASTLRDGCTPFSLTYLRLYHPLGLALISPKARLFSCHLHEFLPATGGWLRLPPPLRRLHLRNTGTAAWDILRTLLERFGDRFVSCREFVATSNNDKARRWPSGTS